MYWVHIEKTNKRAIEARQSGIELLKIIAIILIVISHVINTLYFENPYISYQDYVLDLSVATEDVCKFVLIIFGHFGVWGNTIFFVCSAWFLLHSSKSNKKKWFFMLIEVWSISMIILIITFIIRRGDISVKLLIKSIFPTLFMNNWYLTCYFLFYPIYPLLNTLIKKMSKQALFRICAAMFVIYCCFNFIKEYWFFSSPIILWITIYFVMAYIQLYLQDFSGDKNKNIYLFLFGFVGMVGIAFLMNIMGLHISYFRDKVLHGATNCNPFVIAASIAMFNIFRSCKFKNYTINYISSLSLLIYIIHENLILRTYFRPYWVNCIYEAYGYRNIIFWVFVMATTVFLFGFLCAFLYDKTLRCLIKSGSNCIYSQLRSVYLKLETYLLKLH